MAQPSSTQPTLADAIRTTLRTIDGAHDEDTVTGADLRAMLAPSLRAALPRAEVADALLACGIVPEPPKEDPAKLGRITPEGAWLSNSAMFRSLTPQEVAEFRKWAEGNEPGGKDAALIHPVVRIEWARLGVKA